MLSFFFSSSGDHLDLHSFPTRRSSDLQVSGEADDGAQAIKLAAEQRPDVAVLDVAMPVLSGLDAAQEIKRVSPKTKVILDRKSTRLNSSHLGISYAVFCLKKKKEKHQS